nr:unnamed protein product [Callosobruchus chinensis]
MHEHLSKGFPNIELIKFSGDYNKWPQFRDLFLTLVHNDKSMDNVRKFYYLLGSLQGDAAKVLEAIQVTADNYDIAWNLLLERYENNQLFIKNHVRSIFDLPSVHKDKYTLRNLIDDFNKNFRALKLLGENVEEWDTLLIHLITTKIDSRSVILWEELLINKRIANPKLSQLLDFLSDRCKLFETTDFHSKNETKVIQNTTSKNIVKCHSPVNKDKPNDRIVKKEYAYVTAKSDRVADMKCTLCGDSHYIYRCKKLFSMPVAARISEIKKLDLCLNCLRSGHAVTDCQSQGCRICAQRHNTMLHTDQDNTGPSSKWSEAPVSHETTRNAEITGLSVNYSILNEPQVLLSTVRLLIKDLTGKWHQCRALLDKGSQSNFITANLTEKLQLSRVGASIPIVGVGASHTQIVSKTFSDIKSFNDNYVNNKVEFLILDKITERLPSIGFDTSELKLPPGIQLSDTSFNVPSEIDILLGAGLFYQILRYGTRSLGPNKPVLQNTVFGWVLSGNLVLNNANQKKVPSVSCHSMQNIEVQNQLEKFWQIEEIPDTKPMTLEETECERIFIETTTRNEQGHFVVELPLRDNFHELGILEGSSSTNSINTDSYYLCKDEIRHALGLTWYPNQDMLSYAFNIEFPNKRITKRVVLSVVASIFDPLGLMSPVIISFKILLQQLWQQNLEWDEPLPQKLLDVWNHLISDIDSINSIQVSRHILVNHPVHVELHCFSDASQSAYGCCIYIKSIDATGQAVISLVCSKSRVAPLKTLSIPRLELCGAVLSTRLSKKVSQALKININACYYWVDSTIVLSWISTCPSKLKVFVSNRIAEIQRCTNVQQWAHISSSDNPADLVSRGLNATELKQCTLWWNGPSWLVHKQADWPKISEVEVKIPELKPKKLTLLAREQSEFKLIGRFSSLHRARRVTAWCFRFYHNLKLPAAKRNLESLSVSELNNSTIALLKLAQRTMFPDEISCIVNNKPISKKSKLVPFDPFVDKQGLLRIGGRLNKSSLPYDSKHQILLHPKHHLTRLIVLNEHYRQMHAGVYQLLCAIRQNYWILHGRRTPQQRYQLLWKRWTKDYLLELQRRSKWHSDPNPDNNTIRSGSMVLIIDDNSPPLLWRLGRVIDLHPGTDRVVTVRTANCDIVRAVQKLCLLPLEFAHVHNLSIDDFQVEIMSAPRKKLSRAEYRKKAKYKELQGKQYADKMKNWLLRGGEPSVSAAPEIDIQLADGSRNVPDRTDQDFSPTVTKQSAHPSVI